MLIQLLVLLIVVGFLLWLSNTFVTAIDPRFKTAINAVVLLIVFLYILSMFFPFTFPMHSVRAP